MVKTVNIQEAQAQLPALLLLALSGDEVLIVEGEKILAKLMPINAPSRSRVPGLNRGSMTPSADFNEPLSNEFWMGLE
ncbi:MAG: type II toxin-antitoxin system prevent-host-death family antitoxin [Cyanosarcina radialis HA8281-LM2]|jgi:antitoxin (DNA-binding transcriptional repressor) of toxin-antitoxin stability system|nr:type II toxin-antitoxin system prevent-host-death family antitoxin [Cyanosarcina radialis HA8281-LM2]